MKRKYTQIICALIFAGSLFACEKEASTDIVNPPKASALNFKSTVSSLTLTTATDASNVVTFSFNAADYGASVIPSYALEFDLPADTSGPNAWANAVLVKLPAGVLQKTYKGADFNSLLVNQLGLPTGTDSKLAVRLKVEINKQSGAVSAIKPIHSVLTLTVNPYLAFVEYPALLVKGANSWRTPTVRTNGYLLTSSKFNAKYEGYLDLPNADGWGGDGFQLISTTDAKVYGWGTSATTIGEGGGSLWLTPSPAHMKVNVDLTAKTITYTPVKFFISGDDNSWSLSATPLIYNPTTKTWVAANVALTAGKTFAFTANGSYDISYKVDAGGKLLFAGTASSGAINIPITKTGVYTVTLDLSSGDGNYTYSIK